MCVNHLRVVMIPYFDHPFCSAGKKYCRTIRIPRNVVDWSVVCHVSLEKLRAVFCCTFVNNQTVKHDVVMAVTAPGVTFEVLNLNLEIAV